MQVPSAATKWCHVTWSTAQHRKSFNIAAQSRFCERALRDECTRHGWSAEVALLADRIHILVEVPAVAPRDAVVSRLRDLATQVVRRAGAASKVAQVWEGAGWCSVLTNAVAVGAVRKHIRAVSHQATILSLHG